MRLSSIATLFIFVFSVAVPAQEPAKISLEWKLKKGDTPRYEAGQVMEIDIGGTQVTTEMLFGLAMEVTDVSADGAAKVKMTYDRVKFSASGMLMAEYDSDKNRKPDENDIFAQMFSGFLDKSLTMTVSKTGECTNVEGQSKIVADAAKSLPDDNPMAAQLKESMGKQFGDEGAKSVFQLYLGLMPRETLAVGGTWPLKHAVTGPLGKIEIDGTNTLKELRAEGKEAVVKADAKLTVTPGEGGGVFGAMELSNSKLKSEWIWNLAEGMAQSSSNTFILDGTAGGMDFSIVQKLTLKKAARRK